MEDFHPEFLEGEAAWGALERFARENSKHDGEFKLFMAQYMYMYTVSGVNHYKHQLSREYVKLPINYGLEEAV